MNIVAQTNATNPTFALKACRRLDATDYQTQLVLRSGGFAAEVDFWFDRQSLESTVVCLKEMQSAGVGNCKLSYQNEDPHVKFSGSALGHIAITGLVSDGLQCLQFLVNTDQSALPSLIAGLEELLLK